MNRRYVIAAGATILVLLAALVFINRDQNEVLLPSGPSGSPTPTPSPIPRHEVYVATVDDHSILGYAMDSNGQIPANPTRVIQGPNTGLHNPFDVVTDSSERIYVANLGDPPGTGASVTVYRATANGNVAPDRTLGLFHSELEPSLHKATSVVIRPRPEAVLVADQPHPPPGAGQIMEFSTTAGQDNPITIIRGAATQLESVAGIGLDSLQRILVVDTRAARILLYRVAPASGIVDLPPEALIEGGATGLNNPTDAAVDASGNIFVVNRGSFNAGFPDASITVYAADAIGDSAPVRAIGVFGSPNANLTIPVGIAVDAGGRIFLLESSSLKIFAAGANGDPAPVQVIARTCSGPGGIWVR